MSYSGHTQLMNLLWQWGYFAGRVHVAVTGEEVSVVSPGKYDENEGLWYGTEVIIDGERCRGMVAVGSDHEIPGSVILRVVNGYVPPVLGSNDRLVTQIDCPLPTDILACCQKLQEGSADRECAGKIAGMDSLRRTDLYTKLLVERLQRKTANVADIFMRSQKDWNQTFHVMLLRAMGGNRNKTAFTDLAWLATGAMISREKGSRERVEALLLGAAGFLYAAREKDGYTLRLEEEFRHLANKYSIIPLKPAEWDLRMIRGNNWPTVRLAEIAALLSKKDFMLDNMLVCRNSEDVEKLFCCEASEYWKNHVKPGTESTPSAKRIGKEKVRLVGINLVAPLMFTYGKETGNDELCENAVELLTTIPAEKNRKLEGWYGRGCTAENSFESQALLQLADEYCQGGNCARCHVGRREIKKALECLTYVING